MENSQITILMADDDEDDCYLAGSAFAEVGMPKQLRFVEDGKELLEYLHRQGKFSDLERFPCPDLILLDLNMPIIDGREALKEIKSNPRLKDILIVVLTTSSEESDISLCKNAGVDSFVTKPTDFKEWVEMARSVAGNMTEREPRPKRYKVANE